MKLIYLLVCGLGDMYPSMSVIHDYVKKNDIDNIKIYIDSIYFAIPENYKNERKTTIKMVETISKNWEAVPAEFFGSEDWFGIPNMSRGPVYEDIRNDFLFYRKQCLKDYMLPILNNQTEPFKFIYGMGPFACAWNGETNNPLDFSNRFPIKLDSPTSLQKISLDGMLASNPILIHVRKKGKTITDGYFQDIIDFCNNEGISTITIGLREESVLKKMTYDLRMNRYGGKNSRSIEQTLYLIENSPYMITSGSMYTYHRFLFNKPTIIGQAESLAQRAYCFHPDDLNNPNHIFYDADEPHLDKIKLDILKWYSKS